MAVLKLDLAYVVLILLLLTNAQWCVHFTLSGGKLPCKCIGCLTHIVPMPRLVGPFGPLAEIASWRTWLRGHVLIAVNARVSVGIDGQGRFSLAGYALERWHAAVKAPTVGYLLEFALVGEVPVLTEAEHSRQYVPGEIEHLRREYT